MATRESAGLFTVDDAVAMNAAADGPVSRASRVAVFESIPVVRQAYESFLRVAGFQARVVAEYQSAPLMLDDVNPDVVIVSVGRRDWHGAALCEHVRSRSRAGVIVVAAADDETACVDALRAGADDYIVQPFRARDFLARVTAVAEASGAGKSRQWSPVTFRSRSRRAR